MSDTIFSPERLQEAMGGMSNIDLAEKLGCARSSITMYLSGQRTPSKMTIQLMSICLEVSPAWLMGLDVPKYIEKPTPVPESGPLNEFQDLMSQLTPDEQRLIVSQIKGILSNRE